jgi:hypothetical protein
VSTRQIQLLPHPNEEKDLRAEVDGIGKCQSQRSWGDWAGFLTADKKN